VISLLSEILLLLVLILLNAFFAASEIALISLNDNKISLMAEEGNKKARQIKQLLDEPSKFLATIQIGITLAGFLASAFAAESFAGPFVELIKKAAIPIPESWLKSIAVIIITIVLSYFTLVFGELVPKRLAMKKAESISNFVVSPLNYLSFLTAPFVSLLTVSTNFFVRIFGFDPLEEDEKITEEEIRMMVDVGEKKGAIQEAEKVMINNIFEFNDKTVEEIMTHRTDIVAFPLGIDLDSIINSIMIEKYSRIPVYEDNIDNIVGVLYVKDLIQHISSMDDRSKFDLRAIIRPPYFVPTSKRTDQLLKEIQKNKTHMAIVIDEYGGTAGIATLEDLLEEIVGNIFDEYDDEEEEIHKLDENTFIIDGHTSLERVKNYLNLDLPIDEYETLSGFIIGQLGRIPGPDDKPTLEFDGVIFKVQEVCEKRIAKVKACKA
jgi:putative hemolysin